MIAREHCYRCDKVASMCICVSVVPVENRTGITIVQHPRERRHPFGTVRIARLGLKNVAVHTTAGLEVGEMRAPESAALLFPVEGAPILSELHESVRPRHLVVIDGTWQQAAQLRRNNPTLAALPAVRLDPQSPSRYRIRREPRLDTVSTIEAIVGALKILEPSTPGLDGLLASFDSMIDAQLTRRGGHRHTPRHRARPRLPKPLPDVFLCDSRDVVLVYAELHQPRGQNDRFLIRMTASRRNPERVLDELIRSPIAPSDARVANMELGVLKLENAIEPGALADELRTMIGPTDTVVAWSQGAGPALRALGFRQPFLSAKHHFANQTGGRLGTLDHVVERFGLGRPGAWVPGRAGRQIAQLDRAVSWLQGERHG